MISCVLMIPIYRSAGKLDPAAATVLDPLRCFTTDAARSAVDSADRRRAGGPANFLRELSGHAGLAQPVAELIASALE